MAGEHSTTEPPMPTENAGQCLTSAVGNAGPGPKCPFARGLAQQNIEGLIHVRSLPGKTIALWTQDAHTFCLHEGLSWRFPDTLH